MRNQHTSGNWNIPAEELRRAGIGEQGIAAMNNQVEMSRGWDDTEVSLGQIVLTGTGDPALGAINSSVWLGRTFTNEATEGDEKRIFLTRAMPYSIRPGSNLGIRIRYCLTDAVGATDEVVRWEIMHGAVKAGDAISATTFTTETVSQTLAAGTVANTYGLATLTTRVDERIAEGSLVGVQLRRKSSTAADTYSHSIYILGAGFRIYNEKTGTFAV